MSKKNNSVKTSISLAPQIMERVDAYANEMGLGRSGAMAVLIKQAFEYQEQLTVAKGFLEKYRGGGKIEKDEKDK